MAAARNAGSGVAQGRYGVRTVRIGEVIGGRFELVARTGSGGMADVYRACDLQTQGAPVAVKLLHRHATPEVARFEREASLLGQLEHPGIVRYVAQGIAADGRPYLVMEWLDGESLSERLRRGPLAVAETVSLGRQVASALSVAHRRGVVHRDLKPSNLYLVGGSTHQVKLLDFGVAGVRNAKSTLTATGVMIGSPGYMAPEQVRGERVDPRADVFALGCVLFKCATGQAPYSGEVLAILAKIIADPTPRVSEIRRDVPQALSQLIERMMAKSADARPRDGAAVVDAIDQLGELATQTSSRPSGLTHTERRLMCMLLVRLAAASTSRDDATLDDFEQDALTIIEDPTVRTALTVPQGDNVRRRLRLALARHGGIVDSMGDGSLLVTVTGASSATDQLERAARCALAMREAVPDAPMALVAGRDVTSTSGAFGALIDRAASLIDAAPSSHHIRLDDFTAGLLDAKFDLGGDDHGLYLAAEREAAAPRTLLGKPMPCVGRERVLSSLEALLYECISEPVARPVLISAEAGIGKSRIMQELVATLRGADEPIAVWMGNGDPMSSGSAYGVLATLLRREAALRDGEALAISRRKLAARLSRHVPERDHARICEFMGELVGVPFEAAHSVQLREARWDAILMNDQIRRAWIDLVAAECAAQPVLIALEDLHWGDLPSVELCDAMLRDLSDRPLMLIATARPEVRELFPSLWEQRHLTEIRLPPLTRRGSEQMVHAALGVDLPRATRDHIVKRAAGNAFYLEELIRGAASGHGDTLPDSVLALAQEHLERLDGEARRVLRAASIFGERFWPPGILHLLGEHDAGARLGAWLDTLVAEELIVERGTGNFPGMSEYAFRHSLVREAAYAMLTSDDRTLGHKLAAEWLEQAGERDPVVLASHHERSGDHARAAHFYLEAAESALDGHDLVKAKHWAAAGIARVPRDDVAFGQLQLVSAQAHYWAGEFASVRDAALAALEVLPRGSRLWCDAMRNAAQSSGKVGEHDRLEECAADLLALPSDGRDASEDTGDDSGEDASAYLGALAVCTIELLFAGRKALVPALLARLGRDDDAGPSRPKTAAAIHAARAFDRLYARDLGGYLHHSLQAVLSFEAAGDQRVATLYRINVAYALVEMGLYERGAEALEQALSMAERMGLARLVALAKNNLGTAKLRLGHIDEAMRLEQDAVDAYVESGNKRMEGGSRRNLAAILIESGQLDRAEHEARRAVEVLSVAPPLQAHALATLARVLLEKGRTGDALEATARAERICDEVGDIEDGESELSLTRARALQAAGRIDEARGAIERARERLMERADMLGPSERQYFLTRVPDCAAILALHRALR